MKYLPTAVSRKGKATGRVRLSVRQSVRQFPLYYFEQTDLLWVMTIAHLGTEIQGHRLFKSQKSMFSAYGRGNGVTRSV